MPENEAIQENQYRSMAKGTAMMGGVQVFNILIGLVRGKLVALFLGPQGLGVMSLLQSSGQMVQQVSSAGLHLSTVQAVAGAQDNRAKTIAIIRKLLLITSIFGVVLMIVLSSGLSRLSFGTTNYTWHYCFLAIWLFFLTLSNGESSILQGAHALKRLAYSSLVGSLTGLLVGVPLYYFFGEDGIVPALIMSSLALFVFYKYQSLKQFGHISLKGISLRQERGQVKKLVTLGLVFMIASLLGTATSYLINFFVRLLGSVEDVGLFQAANSLTNQYAGLVFTAMAMDFFPRLSAVSSDNAEVRRLVNNQTEIVILIVAPLVALVILFAPLIVKILLTGEFNSIIPVIQIMAVGLLFKSISYPMGYISFSKGDKKTFFWLEGVCSNALNLTLSVLLYRIWGIPGLGIAFGGCFFIYIFVYLVVTRKLYDYRPSKVVLSLIVPLLIAVSLTFACSFLSNSIISYSLMALLSVVISAFCLFELNKRLDIREIIKEKLFTARHHSVSH